MTREQQLGAILEAIGGLKANVEGLRRDLGEIKEEAAASEARSSQSRGRLYERVEELAVLTTRLEGDVKVAGATSAQARDGVAHLAKKVDEHSGKLDAHIKVVMPIIRKVRRLEWRVTLFLTAVTAVGGGIWWLIASNAGAIWRALLSLLPRG